MLAYFVSLSFNAINHYYSAFKLESYTKYLNSHTSRIPKIALYLLALTVAREVYNQILRLEMIFSRLINKNMRPKNEN